MDCKIIMLNYNVIFALCRITELKHTCVKRCKAKKYGAKLYSRPSTLKSTRGECPHCPYGVGAYDIHQTYSIHH